MDIIGTPHLEGRNCGEQEEQDPWTGRAVEMLANHSRRIMKRLGKAMQIQKKYYDAKHEPIHIQEVRNGVTHHKKPQAQASKKDSLAQIHQAIPCC